MLPEYQEEFELMYCFLRGENSVNVVQPLSSGCSPPTASGLLIPITYYRGIVGGLFRLEYSTTLRKHLL